MALPKNTYTWVTPAVFLIGASLSIAGVTFLTKTLLSGIMGGVLCWTVFYSILGWRRVGTQSVIVIERLGQYLKIIEPGISILCFPGLIDREKKVVSLKVAPITLYIDEPENKIDFKNGSARVVIKVFKGIDTDAARLEQSVWNNVYVTENPDEWIEDTLDDIIRPQLQILTIDEAQTAKDAIAGSVPSTMVRNKDNILIPLLDLVFTETGYRLEKVLITDIALSEKDEDERRKSLEGAKDADRFNQQVDVLIEGYKRTHNGSAPIDEALDEIYARADKLLGYSVIKETKTNITFVASDVKGVMKTIDVSGKNT